jgi:hypothetical protein
MTVQRVEYRNPIRSADHGFPIDGERLGAELGRGAGDRRVPAAPVVSAPGEQPHCVAGALYLQAIAVMLDLMHPAGAGGRLGSNGGNAGLDEAVGTNRSHDLAYRLVSPSWNCQSLAELFYSRIPPQ